MTVELLDIDADSYHADPWNGPSLNATVAKSLVLETPAHAKQKHPKLADSYEPKHTDAMDEGTALHQMLLGDDRCDILNYPDWRSSEARVVRDTCRIAGRTPILRKKWDEIAVLGESLKEQVAAFPIDPPLFVDGMAEQTIMWEEDGIGFRARLDWLRNDTKTIDDLKTSRSAQPRKWQRAMWPLGYDIQAAFYVRAVKVAFGVEPIFRWVAIEKEPPYALSVHVMSHDAMRAAQDKVDLAIDIWRDCLAKGTWPAYAQTVNVVELPEWMRPEVWDDEALMGTPF
jgi:hypothetical protein